jgi:hypothetical protein
MGLGKKYLLYLLRWQLSTVILAPCVQYLAPIMGPWGATVVANLIGGLGFFWYDYHFVFHRKADKASK